MQTGNMRMKVICLPDRLNKVQQPQQQHERDRKDKFGFTMSRENLAAHHHQNTHFYCSNDLECHILECDIYQFHIVLRLAPLNIKNKSNKGE